jgi:membrane protease YdiL (CAAX protease family)
MNTRITTSLVVYALWILVTLLGAKILLGGAEVPLDEMVKNGIGWQFLGAIALLVGFIYARKWRDLAFAPAHSVVRVMWFPAIWLALISAVLLLVGLPPGRMIAFIAVNTLLVGISEETMFRGYCFAPC